FAAPGSGFRAGPGPRRTSGSIRLNRMLDEVVSVARPASSDGGSAPTDIRNTPARPDLPVAAIDAPAAITARRPTSPANIIERFRILLLPPSEGAFVFPSRRLLSGSAGQITGAEKARS